MNGQDHLPLTIVRNLKGPNDDEVRLDTEITTDRKKEDTEIPTERRGDDHSWVSNLNPT